MNTTLVAILAALIIGFGGAWYVQGERWDNDVAQLKLSQVSALAKLQSETDAKSELAENQKEAVQNEFNAFKQSEGMRNAAVSASVKRVYVRATCPAVPETSTGSSGVASGSAELDPAYRQTLSDLRVGAEEQRRLLNVCRAELMIR